MKGRALRRALATADAHRISGDIPLIVDTTELVTPDSAYEMLLRNQRNRPINWRRVEEYAAVMAKGGWELHAQGIVLDTNGDVLTGQKRLWAVIYSGQSVYMRISRGNRPQVARLLDRGDPQSARDLASRGTGRKHTPTEASLARGLLALSGKTRASVDEVAEAIERTAVLAAQVLAETVGTRKTRAALMVLAAVCAEIGDVAEARALARRTESLAEQLEIALQPQSANACWGRGAAFALAMEHARKIVQSARSTT